MAHRVALITGGQFRSAASGLEGFWAKATEGRANSMPNLDPTATTVLIVVLRIDLRLNGC